MGRRVWVAVAVGLAAATSACGGSTTPSASTAASGGPAAGEADASTDGTTTPGTSPSSTTASTTAVAGWTGTYVLTGTQTCRTPGVGESTFPLFEGSAITFDTSSATVTLVSDGHTAPYTADGSGFQISVAYDLSGELTSRSDPNALPFVVDATTSDGGETLSGTASDAGVNCIYSFTGVSSTTSPSPTLVPSTSVSPTTTSAPVASAADCTSISVPGLEPLHMVVECEPPWASASFGTSNERIVRWDGTTWSVVDPMTFCATYEGAKPTGLVGEGEPGRIWTSFCVDHP